MIRDTLAGALAAQKEAVIERWVAAIRADPTSHYALRPVEDVREAATACFEAYLIFLRTGREEAVTEFADRIAVTRSEQGFRISEVQQAFFRFKEGALPVVLEIAGDSLSRYLEMERAIDTCLRTGIASFSKAFQREILRRIGEYVAEIEASHSRAARQQSQLQATHATLRAILDSIPDGIVYYGDDGRVAFVNRSLAAIIGQERVDVLGLSRASLHALIAVPCAPLPQPGGAESASDGSSGTLHFACLDGTILQCVSTTALAGERIIGSIELFRDVTRDREMARLKDEFISTVSHELRTPLTSIRGFIDLMLAGDTGPLNETQRRFLDIVGRNTARLDAMIGDLLDVERIEAGKIFLQMRAVDLGDVLQGVVRTFEIAAREKGIALTLEVEENLRVVGDESRLTQVFTNLVSNAVKYTPQGSIQVRGFVAGDQVCVEIEDTGIGISRVDQGKIFEKFFRVDNSFTRAEGGSGLGLSITRALVDQHGGKITLRSAPRRGTTFIVELPRARR